jgi:hypothetical protein
VGIIALSMTVPLAPENLQPALQFWTNPLIVMLLGLAWPRTRSACRAA